METDVEVEVRLPYSQRPEWADVSPVFVDDGNCVVAVQYTPEHRDALAYFRAVLASGERSERVLQLTADMIGFNQADYTAWQCRWLCIEALNCDLGAEDQLTRNIMTDNAKNYQLWNHRRKCALRAGPAAAQQELDFAAQALNIDEKNYHAWAHRGAIVQAYGLWDQELEFVERMVARDVRNNSAWNQRGHVVRQMLLLDPAGGSGRGGGGSGDDDSMHAGSSSGDSSGEGMGGGGGGALRSLLRRELAYATEQALRAPRNESAWNYMLGLFALPGCRRDELARWPEVHAACVAALNDVPSCPPALSTLAEYYFAVSEATMRHLAAVGARAPGQKEALQPGLDALRAAVINATSLFDGLTFADPIRSMYWTHRHTALQQMLMQAVQAAT